MQRAARALSPLSQVWPHPAVDLIVVGGVPGAGKTTAITAATTGQPGVLVLDPERVHSRLRHALPAWVPYRAYRAIVHTAHTVAVLGHLVRGPVSGRPLIVHDPGTRRRRRRLFLGLAELRGWRMALVYVDVDRAAARDGQFVRGRALRASTFDRHWDRWQSLRDRLGESADPVAPPEFLVTRDDAAAVLRALCYGQWMNWAFAGGVRYVQTSGTTYCTATAQTTHESRMATVIPQTIPRVKRCRTTILPTSSPGHTIVKRSA